MERLTERNPFWIDNEMWLNACEPTDEEIEAVYHRLKEYEDLEDRLNKVYDCDGLLLKVVETIEKHPKLLNDEEVDKWEEYKRLEEQGRLICLPCKVGDPIYGLDQARVCELDTEKIGISKMPSGKILYSINGWEFEKEDFGKTVFLTKSEAEAKLKELRGEENGK